MADDNPSSQRYAQLAAVARKLEADSRYMAHVLRLYREAGKLTEQELVKQLDTTPKMLVRLALCRRPDKHSPQFGAQLQQLATYTGIDEHQLEAMIQRVSD